jgi:DNA polymerase-1
MKISEMLGQRKPVDTTSIKKELFSDEPKEEIAIPKMEQTEKDYREITTKTELLFYLKKCIKTGYFSFDFETAPSKRTREEWSGYLIKHGKKLEDHLEHFRVQKIAVQETHGATGLKRVEKMEKKAAAELDKEFKIAQTNYFSSSTDPHRNKICTMSISAAPNEARVLFLDHLVGKNFELSAEEVFDILGRKIFSNKDVIKIAFNLVFETKCLLKYNKYLLKPVSDPHISGVRIKQAINTNDIADPKKPAYGMDLKTLTGKYFGVELPDFLSVLEKNNVKFFDEFEAGNENAVEYASHDSDYGLQLHLYYEKVAKQIEIYTDTPYKDYWGWLCEVEMPFARVIGLMEYNGVAWNHDQGEKVYEIALKNAEEAKARLKSVADRVVAKIEENDPFYPEASLDIIRDLDPGKTGKNNAVKHFIFEVLDVEPATYSNKTGLPSMDYASMLDMIFMLENNLLDLKEEKFLVKNIPEEWIAQYKDQGERGFMTRLQRTAVEIHLREPKPFKEEALEALQAVLDIQKAGTLISSHIEGRIKWIHPVTSRIHSGYTLWTETSRLNSSKPNCQNIPRPDNDPFKIRNLYEAPEGKALILIDYSGFELRIMAWASQDKTMLDLFKNNGDMHRLTASTLTGKPMEEITKEERRDAKAGNFGISYGGTEHSLQKTLKTMDIRKSIEECDAIVKAIKKTYPGVPAFQTEIAAKARKQGFVETIFGYRRMLGKIRSNSSYERGQDERRAANTPIQGTAADIMKSAQNKVYEYIYNNRLHGKFDMIAQVHDEIVFEVDDNDELIDKVIRDVKAIMEEKPVDSFNIDLIAEASVSKGGWADKQDYIFD